MLEKWTKSVLTYSVFLLSAVRQIDNAELVRRVRKLRGDTNTSTYASGTKDAKGFRKMIFLLLSSSSAYCCCLVFFRNNIFLSFISSPFYFFLFFLKFLISFCYRFVQDQMLSACTDEYLSASVI